jgi:hypothetical protein
MKRKAILRGLLGFPIGIAMGYFITIIVSLAWGNGSYLSSKPELIATMGSEINAVILQTVLCGLLGALSSASTLIWGIEQWSLAKQTGIFFLISACLLMPIAYYANWMQHSFIGFLTFSGIFIALFVIEWITMYFVLRYKIGKINAKFAGKQ